MRRAVHIWPLEIFWVGYGAFLLAAFAAVVWSLFIPAVAFPFSLLGAPLPILLLLLGLRRVLAPGKPDPMPVAWALRAPAWIWVAAYAMLLAALALRKHAALESHGSDLGIFVNLFWNLTHGGGWHSGMLERHFFGEHFSPLLILIAPLYRLWPAPECLLAVQSAALALAAWPIYQLARARLGHGAGLVVLAAYFTYPPLLGVALHDFHEVALAVPLLGFALWWLDQKRTAAAVLALAAAVLCKEELALTAAAVGVVLVIARRDWKTGGALFFSGLAVFWLLVDAVLPAFRGEPLPFADRYSQFTDGLSGILALATHDPARLLAACWSPDKWDYLLDLLRPLGFLPVLAPLECLPALPTLARNLLSNHEPQFSIYFHYPAPMIPFLFAAAIAGLARVRDGLLRLAPGVRSGARALFRLPPKNEAHPLDSAGGRGAALGWLALAALLWGSGWPAKMDRFAPSDRVAAFRELCALIPAEASVSAHNRLVPHVANRREVCTFPVIREAEYILLDFGYPGYEYPVHTETHRQRFLQMLAGGQYRLLATREKFALLQRQAATPSGVSPETLADLFFLCRREHLEKITTDHDVLWQGPRLFFPPGRWRATVTLTPSRHGKPNGPIVFSMHPYLGGQMGEWALGSLVYDPAPVPGAAAQADISLSWEFDQPRRQMLTLRIMGDRHEHFVLNSLEFQRVDRAVATADLLLPEPGIPSEPAP